MVVFFIRDFVIKVKLFRKKVLNEMNCNRMWLVVRVVLLKCVFWFVNMVKFNSRNRVCIIKLELVFRVLWILFIF